MVARKTRFERMFSYHVEQFRTYHGDEKTAEYLEWADYRFKVFLWCSLCSLLLFFLTAGSLIDLPVNTISKTVLISLYLLYFSADILSGLGSINEIVANDSYYARKWRSWSVAVMILSGSAAIFNIGAFVSILDLSGLRKDVVEFEDLGIKITIPRKWSDVDWEIKTKPGALRPKYQFNVDDGKRAMTFSVSGWKFRPDTDVTDLFRLCERNARSYLDGGLTAPSEIVTVGGVKLFKAVGLDKGRPNQKFVYYVAFHQGCEINYIYTFLSDLDYDEEMARAESMFEIVELTAVPVPDHAYKVVVPKSRPVSSTNDASRGLPVTAHMLEESSGSVDIKSAGINISIPDGCGKPVWMTKNSGSYIFKLDMGGYMVECDTRVVWTSENAVLSESEDDFTSRMNRILAPEMYVRPAIVDFGNKSVMKAAGEMKNSDYTAICYLMIHKGARLRIEAAVPLHLDYRGEMKRLDTFVKNIGFY